MTGEKEKSVVTPRFPVGERSKSSGWIELQIHLWVGHLRMFLPDDLVVFCEIIVRVMCHE